MERKETTTEALQDLLAKLENLEVTAQEEQGISLELLGYLKEALALLQEVYEDKAMEAIHGHVINYCIMKLEFAKTQVEYGDVEEGLKFTQHVLHYYLKEIG
ncbi:hypothetical protein ACD591_03695 [Rufibacter glacialis]|uniref:Uncharacterized protein n=1 Tax=Rufibacter glacialis TaxID=1259555 RepID=A0A5M8QEN8_9BACT|nr:hypothetical protein [Rufibacter glacialis]KAA6434469.1 hypothetical protein FOE74_09765 [Rufibacter glacialis]GGK69933.1 hypothetical protein GCM10011405_17440 [Rufibacter glacialis]